MRAERWTVREAGGAGAWRHDTGGDTIVGPAGSQLTANRLRTARATTKRCGSTRKLLSWVNHPHKLTVSPHSNRGPDTPGEAQRRIRPPEASRTPLALGPTLALLSYTPAVSRMSSLAAGSRPARSRRLQRHPTRSMNPYPKARQGNSPASPQLTRRASAQHRVDCMKRTRPPKRHPAFLASHTGHRNARARPATRARPPLVVSDADAP